MNLYITDHATFLVTLMYVILTTIEPQNGIIVGYVLKYVPYFTFKNKHKS